MKHFTGYGAYLLFLALRTHFNNVKYDFFLMHGKLRATKESYNNRKDKYFFEKLAKLYNSEQLRDFYIANFLEDVRYVTNMLDDQAHKNYIQFTKRNQSLTYNFSEEVDMLFSMSCNDIFKVKEDKYPGIIVEYLQKGISPETLVILDDFIKFSLKFDKYYDKDVIWPKVSLKVRKYRPFLKYDGQKMKTILKEKINERGNCI